MITEFSINGQMALKAVGEPTRPAETYGGFLLIFECRFLLMSVITKLVF